MNSIPDPWTDVLLGSVRLLSRKLFLSLMLPPPASHSRIPVSGPCGDRGPMGTSMARLPLDAFLQLNNPSLIFLGGSKEQWEEVPIALAAETGAREAPTGPHCHLLRSHGCSLCKQVRRAGGAHPAVPLGWALGKCHFTSIGTAVVQWALWLPLSQ